MNKAFMLGIGLTLAGACAMAQPVVGLGRVEVGAGAGAVVVARNAPVPQETLLKAGAGGAILVFPDRSRIRLAPESLFVLSAGSTRVNPPLESPVESPDATSAIKSILTQQEKQRFRNQAELAVARDTLTLQSGAMIADQGVATMDVRVLNQTLRSSEARFVVSVVSPESARLTVAQGKVTVAPGLAGAIPVGEGQFTLLNANASGQAVALAPSQIAGSKLAVADEAALRCGGASQLEAVGERTDHSKDPEPVGERLGDPGAVGTAPATAAGPGVGTGPSVPFDLRRVRLLTPPSTSNTSGIVVSPAQP